MSDSCLKSPATIGANRCQRQPGVALRCQESQPPTSAFAKTRQRILIWRWCFLLLAMPMLSGCTGFRQRYFPQDPFAAKAPRHLDPGASLAEVTAHLNRNVVHSWQSHDVSIRAKGVAVSLSADIAVENPRRLRLIAKTPAGNEVELGSNDNEFWYWVKRADPKHVFWASHETAQNARRPLPIPFQPNWLMEALGVKPVDDVGMAMHTTPDKPNEAQLVTDHVSPQGQVVRKVIVIDTYHGLLLRRALFNAANQLIAEAVYSEHKVVEAPNGTRVVLPHQVAIRWPQAEMEMKMTFGHIEVDPQHMPEQLWQRRDIPGYPPYDLSHAAMQAPDPANEPGRL